MMTAVAADSVQYKFIEEIKKLRGRTNSRLNILFKEEYDALLAEVKHFLTIRVSSFKSVYSCRLRMLLQVSVPKARYNIVD